MHIAYFDESKSDPQNGRPWYIVGGFVVPMSLIGSIEEEMSKISRRAFGSDELVPSTEFHGTHIYQGKGPFKGMAIDDRLAILNDLLAILASEDVRLVFSAIDVTKLYKESQAPEFAFMHFCERANSAVPAGSSAILIADLDDEQSRKMVQEFSRYRKVGTHSKYGSVLKKIVDSVHFTRSHHSRLIQLADVYAYALTTGYHPKTGHIAEKYAKIRAAHDLFPKRYKEWPKS